MGRPERAVDVAGGAVAEFATKLRELRRAAGSPSYRQLARDARFSATTLSAAAAGHRLPSLDVVLGYVRACGGDEQDWQRRWTEAARAAGSIDTPVAGDAPPVPVEERRRRLPSRWAVVAVAAVVLVGSAVALALGAGADGKAARPPASGAVLPTPSTSDTLTADYTDPKVAGCAGDATTLASAAAVGSDHVQYGIVELRYSPRCRFAWTRYTPNTAAAARSTVVITIDRPDPLGNTSVTFEVLDGAVYSDGLRLADGCATASAVVKVGGRTTSATTGCTRAPAS